MPMARFTKVISPTTRRIAIKDTMSLPNADTLEDSRITLFQAKERKKGQITLLRELSIMEKELTAL